MVTGQGCAVRFDKGRRELNADVGGAAWDKIEMAPGHRIGPLPKAEDFVRDKLAKILVAEGQPLSSGIARRLSYHVRSTRLACFRKA
jgi:hypothetical protein